MKINIPDMDAEDHQRVIAELDVLSDGVAEMILRFEETGTTSIMKDDYVALHTLAHRIMELRLKHSQAQCLKMRETGTAFPRFRLKN